LYRGWGRFAIISEQIFVIPQTPAASLVIFWRNFHPHMGPHGTTLALKACCGALEIIFKQVFVVPKTSGRSQVIFWNFFYPNMGPQFGRAGGPMRGRGAFAIIFKHIFVVPKTCGESHLIFLEFFYPLIWNVGINLSPHIFTCKFDLA
jgi:hypothetical protein